MKPIQEVYPNVGEEPFYGPGDYDPMLASLGAIVVQVDDHDYQGDSRVLYRDGDRWGVLLFGWGSCSGCDALQACGTYDEIDRLRTDLAESIRWGTREETIAYLRGKDWDVESTYRTEETAQFVRECLAALGAS